MSLFREAQANPEEPVDLELSELQAKVEHVVKVLDAQKQSIHTWFWKGLLAFNLILGSLAIWLLVLPAVLH